MREEREERGSEEKKENMPGTRIQAPTSQPDMRSSESEIHRRKEK